MKYRPNGELPTWITLADFAPKEPKAHSALFEPIGCAVAGVLSVFALIWLVWFLHYTPDSAQMEEGIEGYAAMCETEEQCAALAEYLTETE